MWLAHLSDKWYSGIAHFLTQKRPKKMHVVRTESVESEVVGSQIKHPNKVTVEGQSERHLEVTDRCVESDWQTSESGWSSMEEKANTLNADYFGTAEKTNQKKTNSNFRVCRWCVWKSVCVSRLIQISQPTDSDRSVDTLSSTSMNSCSPFQWTQPSLISPHSV